MSEHIDLVPPQTLAENAEMGLRLRREFHRGGTQIGIARARDLRARKRLSEDTIKRMASYFARHAVDKQAADFGNRRNPSAGYIAWLLWGGDEGRDWAERKKAEIERVGQTG